MRELYLFNDIIEVLLQRYKYKWYLQMNLDTIIIIGAEMAGGERGLWVLNHKPTQFHNDPP